MGQAPIKFGWIPYWNLLPLQKEVVRISNGTIPIQSGHPSAVNKWLMDGSVHIAPASSIALLKSKKLEMAFPIGIASEGPVQSVYIGLHREHQEFFEYINYRQLVLRGKFAESFALHADNPRKLAANLWNQCKSETPQVEVPKLILTSASAASAALTKVMMNLWLGQHTALQMFDSAICTGSILSTSESPKAQLGTREIKLIIGDEALTRRHEFWKILDLGQIWNDVTSLPFVFGLWQTSLPHVPQTIKNIITEAASIAQARMTIEPQGFLPITTPLAGDGKPVDLAQYWKIIQYKLTERHMKSLLIYFALYQQIKTQDEDYSMAERFVRWTKNWTDDQSVATY